MTANLKELLEKYKTNTATEEERQQIEEKIEEFNLLQDYLLKDDESFHFSPEDSSVIDTKKLKKQVNRKIYRLVLLTFSVIIGIVLAFHFLLSPMLNQLYFNPTKKEADAPIATYDLVSGVYTELTNPMYRLNQVTVKQTGIGSYDITKTFNKKLNTIATNFPTLNYTIKRNNVKPTLDGSIYSNIPPIWKMTSKDDKKMADLAKKQTLSKLVELPESSEVDATFSFNKPLTIEEVFNSLEITDWPGDSNYQINWFSVDSENHLTLGFDWTGTFPILGDQNGANNPYLMSLNKKYPNLFPSVPQSQKIKNLPTAMEEHFISSLSYILDQQDIVEKQEQILSVDDMKRTLKKVKASGVKIDGIYISGTVGAITKYGKNDSISNIDILGTNLYSKSFHNPK